MGLIMPTPPARPLLLGLAMWSHNHWQQSLYGTGCKTGERLARYAEVFDTVEGNTTFYATPAITTVKKSGAMQHRMISVLHSNCRPLSPTKTS